MFPEKTDGFTAVPRFLPPETANAPDGLALAFIGDAVWSLMARDFILSQADARVQTLHERTAMICNAAFQAAAAERIAPKLTAQEEGIFKRGRNARVGHVPKNKSQAEYHRATGVEALFGWLYLRGESERIGELFRAAIRNDPADDMKEDPFS